MGIQDLIEPPHNTKSEEGLLGIILQNEMMFYEVRVKSDRFYYPLYKSIFSAIEEIKKKTLKLDLPLIESYVGDNDKLYDLYSNIYSPSNIQAYEDDIYSCYVRRNLIRSMRAITTECYDSDDVSSILSKLSKVADFGALSKNKKVSDCMIEIAMSIGNDQNFIGNYGFEDLDKVLGGYMEGQLVVVGARPGVGKTLVACNLIDHLVKSGINSCFFTLEMTATEISKRILAKRSDVSMRQLDRDKSQIDKVQIEASKILETGYDFEIIDDVFDYSSIVIEIKKQVLMNSAKVVYIDYLGLIDYADGSKTDNTTYSIGQITKSLKRLAKEMGITIVLLSQLNRDGANGKPNKAQLRSSGSIEQDADVIILLYQSDDEMHKNYVEFIIDKNRNGVETSLYLGVEKRTMKIYTVDQSISAHF